MGDAEGPAGKEGLKMGRLVWGLLPTVAPLHAPASFSVRESYLPSSTCVPAQFLDKAVHVQPLALLGGDRQ